MADGYGTTHVVVPHAPHMRTVLQNGMCVSHLPRLLVLVRG